MVFNEESLVKKASYLRITARSLADGMKAGTFRSLYKGQGIEFSGVREYFRGDDIRTIDWNLTARMHHPYVKVFEEERELQIFIIVDNSLSIQIGSGKRTKYEVAAETAALVTIASEMNSCPLGAVFFDGDIHFSTPPKLGREQTMLILSHLDKMKEKEQNGSVLGNAITGAGKMLKKRSLVFIISDFRSADWEKPLTSLAHKNDVVAIRVVDKMDEHLPEVGTAYFTDCESSLVLKLPTASEKFQKEWKSYYDASVHKWQDICIKHGICSAIMKTTDEPLQILTKIFATSGTKN